MKTLILLVFCTVAVGCSEHHPAAVSAPAQVAASGESLCRANLTKLVAFKDPASVRINSVTPNPDRAGRFFMSVSAKNSFGGYGDAITCTCGTDVGVTLDMHCDSPSGV
jgi:hypothetical protein